jgi:hypothetical protein
MPRKCDNCGSFHLEGNKVLHLFRQCDGSFSDYRTEQSVEDICSIVWVCKDCTFKSIQKLEPFPLKNGQYMLP